MLGLKVGGHLIKIKKKCFYACQEDLSVNNDSATYQQWDLEHLLSISEPQLYN